MTISHRLILDTSNPPISANMDTGRMPGLSLASQVNSGSIWSSAKASVNGMINRNAILIHWVFQNLANCFRISVSHFSDGGCMDILAGKKPLFKLRIPQIFGLWMAKFKL